MIPLDVDFLPNQVIAERAQVFLAQYGLSRELPVPVEEVIEQKLNYDIVPTPNLQRDFDIEGFTSFHKKWIYVDDTAGPGGNLPTGFNSEAGLYAPKGQNRTHRLEIEISKNSKRLAYTDNLLILYFFDIGLPGTLHTFLYGLIGWTKIGIHA